MAEILEAYISEYGETIVSLGGSTDHVLFYGEIEATQDERIEAAVTMTEDIVEHAQF